MNNRAADAGADANQDMSPEMKAISTKELSSAAVIELAENLEQRAVDTEAGVDTSGDLNMVLGNILMEKLQGSKSGAQKFFRELDANGDGTVSRIEFKQMMRKLGLVGDGAQFDAKSVDTLFTGLDEDGGGALDLGELTAGLKNLKARVHANAKRDAASKEEAELWRARAQQMRESAEGIGKVETMAAALEQLRSRPPTEVQLADLIAAKQLKPEQLLAKLDQDGGGDIEEPEFRRGLQALGVEATPHDMFVMFEKLDTDGSGSIEIDEIRILLIGAGKTKERYKEELRQKTRALANAQHEAKKIQSRVRQELMEDQQKNEDAAKAAVQAAEEQRKADEAAALAAAAKAQARENWKLAKEAEFERRIDEKRKK